ncbi:recombination protein NinG [Actibacterium pelagium]|uniref:Uncharacterized protein n=1 Tax=Actibacterium pelagium TaxID=2029103 RepID=A0A917EI26_9RHOB|nr:hypothetical protein [Actibacterium pelagium]GGE46794.1 hypothetical protein GCM10011517_13170 [Actibacterium pelagium]
MDVFKTDLSGPSVVDEVSREKPKTAPKQSVCPNCGTLFKYRSNKTYCSPKCRKNASKKRERINTPANAANSLTKAREQAEKFDLALRMAERLYSLPPFERLGYIETIIRLARDGHSPLVRDILLTPQLLLPNPEDKHLFHRRQPLSYCTISQAANRYCIWSPWANQLLAVVRGDAPEPPTGEVFSDGGVDDPEPRGHRSNGFRTSQTQGVDTLIKENRKVHPWYGLGNEYPYKLRPQPDLGIITEKCTETVFDEINKIVEVATAKATEAGQTMNLPDRPPSDWGYENSTPKAKSVDTLIKREDQIPLAA